MSCRGLLGSNDPLRLVGDPVDVVTGDVIDATVDARLDGPFPFRFLRHYSSANAGRDRGLGWGHAHGFEHTLRFTYDSEIGYTGPGGNFVGFPILARDGDETAHLGYRLERKSAKWYRLHLPDGDEVLEFELRRPDWPAPLVAVSHPSGTIRLFYDGATGRLSAFGDSLGHTIRVDWIDIPDPHGRAAPSPHIAALVLTDPTSKTTEHQLISYQYDAHGRLLAGTDAYRNTFSFEYDDRTRMRRLTDRRGYSFFFAYDDRGRCVHTSGEDGVENVRLEYLEGSTIVTLADGGTWLYQHSGGFLERIIDPYGGEHRRELDAEGQLSSEVDGAGREFEIARDEMGKALGRHDSKGYLWPMGEAPRAPAHAVPRNAREWEYGRIVAPGHGLPIRRYLEIDGGLPQFVLNSLTPRSTGDVFADVTERWKEVTVRDAQGLRLRVERADGFRRSWSYDENGNPERYTDFDGSTQRWSYTSWNHTRDIVGPLGTIAQLEHSPREQLTRVVDASEVTSEYTYDLKNRLVGVRRDGIERERYSYDAGDELVEKIDGNGHWLVRYEREDEGRKVTRTLANGERHELLYTPARRLQSAVLETPDGKRDVYALDQDVSGVRVRDERNGLGVRRRFFDARGVEVQVLGRFSTVYDWKSNDRLEIIDPTGAKHAVQRCRGGIVRRRASNGTSEVTQYHPHGYSLAKIVYTSEKSRWDRFYDRSGEGDLTAIRDSARGTHSFTYDAAHRLVKEDLPSGESRKFSYTDGSDLIEAPGLQGVLVWRHKLHTANGSRFDYDHRGNLCARHSPAGSIFLQHDPLDQLSAVRASGWGEWTARYDVLSRRIESTFNGATTQFYWDSDRLAAEVFPDKSVRVYVYADDFAFTPMMFVDYASIDADPASGKRYFVFANHLGAPELIQDDAGQVVWRARYDAYGTAHVEIGADFHQPLRWPGHYFDRVTGLQYARFRYYVPELGRFIETDPSGIRGGFNLHAYAAQGNPLRDVDVRGLSCDPKPGGPEEEGRPPRESTDTDAAPTPQTKKPLTREEGQAVIDAAIRASKDPKSAANISLTLTQLRDGRLVLTGSNRDRPTRPEHREGARKALRDMGRHEEADRLLVQDEPGNAAHRPRDSRELTGPDGAPLQRGNHGEARGIKVGQDVGSPAERQWTSSGADHGGAACPSCAPLQQQHGVINETGMQPPNGNNRHDGKTGPTVLAGG